MICEPCRKGADYLASILKAEDMTLYVGDVEIAKRYHEVCKGCDCQHKVDSQVEGRTVVRPRTNP